jgi:hypothetical protein
MYVPESLIEMSQHNLHTPAAKLIPRMSGGLGNQLFCYAAARRIAIVNQADLVIDNLSGFTYDNAYQRQYQLDHFNIPCRIASYSERLEPLSRLRRKLLRIWNQRKPFQKRAYIVQESNVDFDPRLLLFKPQGTVYLEGYWQSEDYFKDIEPQIRIDLCLRPPQDEINQKMADQIRQTNAVAVHIRFFDQPDLASAAAYTNNAPDDYYHRAISVMEQRLTDAHYYLFSDQPDAARARIQLPNERVTLIHHNQGDAMAYADLWLMTQCKHFIIANSTFSWWGAWLANNSAKQVIAPGFEMRYGSTWWGFKGLLPNAWLKL